MSGIPPRGDWQCEIVREWRDANDMPAHALPTRADLLEISNSYADQREYQYGEGAHPEGRAHLAKLIKACEAMITRGAN